MAELSDVPWYVTGRAVGFTGTAEPQSFGDSFHFILSQSWVKADKAHGKDAENSPREKGGGAFDFRVLLNTTSWALPPPVLIPRDFFPWIGMQASSKRAGRRAQQLKPLCCSEGNVVVCFRQQLFCHFPLLVVLAPQEGGCVDVGMDSS